MLKKQDWVHTIYFDAFAGTGTAPIAASAEPALPLDDDATNFIVGSAKRALDLDSAFSEYIFVEKGRTKARELERLKSLYPAKADRIKVENADANSALRQFCATRDWRKCRAVVFLDPFGNQVEWSTIEAIAATMAIDIWYLFPAGLGVHRQIGHDAQVDAEKEASLTRLYGTSEWKTVLISEEQSPDLFGDGNKRSVKVSTPALATEFMLRCMRPRSGAETMAGLSDIEWTDATWNPISGCVMVSPGCTHCYAMRMAARLQAMEHSAYTAVTRKSGGGRPVWTGRLHINDAALEIPLRWRSPRRIFVNSMSDLFQEGVPREIIRKVWDVMKRAKQHTYQILTKRPENMMAVIEDERIAILPNVWLGTSVESADYTDRIAVLRQIPAAVRFVSFEPLLGPVGRIELRDVHWAIVGGESGPSARPMDARWVTEIKSMCDRSGTAFFFKQWGGTNKRKTGRLLQGRTWDEYPAIGVSGAR